MGEIRDRSDAVDDKVGETGYGSRLVTRLLEQCGRGDTRSAEQLMRLVGPELERLARYHLRRERADHTLDTSALVHETYIRLSRQRNVRWKNRKHFFVIASETMRRILCDYARYRKSEKRGGPVTRRAVSISRFEAERSFPARGDRDLPLDVERALDRLAAKDRIAAEAVRLRYFDGLTLDQIADRLGTPPRTLSRKLRLAKAVLFHELSSLK